MKDKAVSKLEAIVLPLALLAIGAGACGSGGTGGTGGTGGNGGVCMGTTITANEANDYSFSSTLTFPPIKVKPKSELQFDWSGVTADFIKHPIDPKKDLKTILLFEWDLTLNDLQTKLNADSLQSRDLTIVPPLSYATDGNTTSARTMQFKLNGQEIGSSPLVSVENVLHYFDPAAYDPASHVFTVMASSSTELGVGTEMIQSFQLDENSSNTTVTMTKDSTKLEFQADLTRLTPTTIPPGQANITLDWSKMTTNALGADFSGMYATYITAAFIGRYKESAAELSGSKFLDLELIAQALYRKTVDSGTSADFSTFKDASGNAFKGIDDTDTWLVGLQCGGCRNPAPWYISVLKPCTTN